MPPSQSIRQWVHLAALLLIPLSAVCQEPSPVRPVVAAASFEEGFDEAGRIAWHGDGGVRCPGRRGQALRLENPPGAGSASALLTTTLEVPPLAGRTVLMSAWVKGERISAKPLPYLGGKLMLTIARASGPTSYPQVDIEVGTFDWKPAVAEIDIPADTTAITLTIGLQEVTGSILFDDIAIEPASADRIAARVAEALRMQPPPPADPSWTATVRVSSQPGPEVNPLIFGDNVEAWNPANNGCGYSIPLGRTASGLWNPVAQAPRPEVQAILRETGVSVLRYPGGNLVAGFDWRKTVGPLAERPDNVFGLGEFLDYCRDLGVLPIITIADFRGTAAEAAALVEYVNAPADAAHPWAQQRAADGHPTPWGVRYFELGNESYTRWTAAQYGTYAVAYSRAMKAVDPTILTGALLDNNDAWPDIMLPLVKDDVDFIIDHLYPAGIWKDGRLAAHFPDLVMRAVVASTQDLERTLAGRRARILRHTGRNLPLAITEYNGGQANQKPIPYRFTLGTALFAADFRRVMQNPAYNILMANYWQGVGGYWGLVQPADGQALAAGIATAWRRMPAYYLFRLWAQHCGTRQLAVQLAAPSEAFPGYLGVLARGGDSGNPPFEPLTAFASLSADRATVHLLLFNKHAANGIATEVVLDGSMVHAAKAWVVTGPALAAWNAPGAVEVVTETVSGTAVPIDDGRIRFQLPARAMAALDLQVKP